MLSYYLAGQGQHGIIPLLMITAFKSQEGSNKSYLTIANIHLKTVHTAFALLKQPFSVTAHNLATGPGGFQSKINLH